MVAELEKTNTQGAIGKIVFNKSHQVVYGEDPSQAAVSLAFQWRAGKRRLVYPEAVADGTFELPGK